MNKRIRIGTRGSQLALAQADIAKKAIAKLFPEKETDIIIIKTKGDKILDTSLAKIGDKGLFTKELEYSLLKNEIDLAVHSLKDLPSELESEFKLGAVLPRGDFRDALVCRKGLKLHQLTSKDIIATSSLRRISGLKHINKGFNIVDIRGNIQTRIKKMEEGYCDAMILAAVGLKRLQLNQYITEILEPSQFIPAVGQGAIAFEVRSSDDEIISICDAVNDEKTWVGIRAERAFMNRIEGGCQVPVGSYSAVGSKEITITGFISSIDGTEYIKDSISGSIDKPIELGSLLANNLIERGGKDILDKIRSLN